MGNPIENLGDYNRVRKDLQAKNGDLDALYKDVGDTAIEKAAPKLLLYGVVIGICSWELGKKGIKFMRERKQKLKNEPALKTEFIEMIEINKSSYMDTEEPLDSKI